MRTITIELRVDFDESTPEGKLKLEIIMKAAKQGAKHLWTKALLIKDKRNPQIALLSGDMFTATEEINMEEDLPEEETADEEVRAS